MTDMKKMPPGMLEQFEAAFRARFGCGIAEVAASEHEESMALMGAAMWAWQASREAVVIDLSRAMIPGGGYFEDQDTIAAIEAHGLKVTP